MALDRIARARSVEYKISFVQKKREIYVYLGSTWAGRIIRVVDDYLHKEPHFGVFLQLPGLWGPVAREASAHEAKISASIYIRKWLDTFADTPTEPEERAEKEVVERIRRTRPGQGTPQPIVQRVTRTRTRG